MIINQVVPPTKGNSHLYRADESPSMRAVPLHLFFICVSLQASLFLYVSSSLPTIYIIQILKMYPIAFLFYYIYTHLHSS